MNSVAKCVVLEDSVCLGSAWLSLIYRSHVEGGVRDGEVWLDGEGVGQGHRPDFRGR